MNITRDIVYLGVNDKEIDLFEGQYEVPCGVTYNSYAIIDEKIAVMDSVDFNFGDEWLQNIKSALGERLPDYLVVSHMEPDHSANIVLFAKTYPDARIVASAKAFAMMKNFFGTDFSDRRVVVGEGDTLSLGAHTLSFITAPMVHWPEVIMTYDSSCGALFSADAFGRFGSFDASEPWADEARRYYIGIVGKYGAQVQNVLKKVSALDIKMILPLHGPVLSEDLGYYVDLYSKWSSYTPEEEGTVIAYASIYGNTAVAAELLAQELERKGRTAVLHDLSRCDIHEAIADSFRYSTLVIASPTYNADIFPAVRTFIDGLRERGYTKRTVALMENGSWAPMAAKVMRGILESFKGLNLIDESVKILSVLNKESIAQLNALADKLI